LLHNLLFPQLCDTVVHPEDSHFVTAVPTRESKDESTAGTGYYIPVIIFVLKK